MQDINHKKRRKHEELCQNTKEGSIVKGMMSSKGIQYLGQSTKMCLTVMRTLYLSQRSVEQEKFIQSWFIAKHGDTGYMSYISICQMILHKRGRTLYQKV